MEGGGRGCGIVVEGIWMNIEAGWVFIDCFCDFF